METLPIVHEDLELLGPAMRACTELQRRYVDVYMSHPNWTQADLAKAAGYNDKSHPNYLAVVGHKNARHPAVVAAIREEGVRRFQGLQPVAIEALAEILRDRTTKGRDKIILAVLDRTGLHAKSEQMITVDDKRPQTREEALAYLRKLVDDNQSLPAAEKAKIIEGEFTEIDPEVEGM